MVIIVVLSLAAGVVLGMGIGKKCGYARHLAFREGLGQPKDGRTDRRALGGMRLIF